MKIKNLYMIIIFSIMYTALFTYFTAEAQSNNNFSYKKNYTIGYMKNLFNQVDLNDAEAALKIWVNELVKSFHYNDGYNLRYITDLMN